MSTLPTKYEQSLSSSTLIRFITAELVTASAVFLKSREANTVHDMSNSFRVTKKFCNSSGLPGKEVK